ncbi:putative protein TPRXL [Phoenix dactylifera]|uniref:Transmembrane protein n=1 Tax=Phoenix dactylifera TaxID=42345 RepID=A0A8B9AXA5_PHODC|nr:putative protein TPRXL [Phoenix dactylifera]
MRALSKRRTWVFLFLVVYSLLLSSSWNLLLSIRSWYNSAAASASSRAAAGWKALYASMLYGGVFGLLSMGAALAVAVPATLVTGSRSSCCSPSPESPDGRSSPTAVGSPPTSPVSRSRSSSERKTSSSSAPSSASLPSSSDGDEAEVRTKVFVLSLHLQSLSEYFV